MQMILAQALISIISDFVLSLFPIVILHKLNMRLKQKIGIAVLMGLGLITAACSIVRTVLNGQALAGDATYGGLTNWFWRLFEVDLGLICACVPTLVPMWKWASKKLRSSTWVSRMNSYTPRVSFSKGRPSVSKGTSSKRSKGSLGIIKADRNGWQENKVKEPKRAMLASRTDRALMGRAGHFDDMTTMKTEIAPDVEPGTNTTADGAPAQYPQTEAERQNAAQEWESSLRMPWMSNSRNAPHPNNKRESASDIEIARNTSLTITLEEPKRKPGHNLQSSSSRYPLVGRGSTLESHDENIEMEQLDSEPGEQQHGGAWSRLVTAVSGGDKKSGNWKKMHSPKSSRG